MLGNRSGRTEVWAATASRAWVALAGMPGRSTPGGDSPHAGPDGWESSILPIIQVSVLTQCEFLNTLHIATGWSGEILSLPQELAFFVKIPGCFLQFPERNANLSCFSQACCQTASPSSARGPLGPAERLCTCARPAEGASQRPADQGLSVYWALTTDRRAQWQPGQALMAEDQAGSLRGVFALSITTLRLPLLHMLAFLERSCPSAFLKRL